MDKAFKTYKSNAACDSGNAPVSNGAGVYCIDEYMRIALDYVSKYPLTEFMTDRHIDFDTATVKQDVDINVVLIGFGKVNKSIFDALISTNQFLTKTDMGVCEKPVNYFVYTDEPVCDSDDISSGFFRYKSLYSKLKDDGDKYLPLPDIPASVEFFDLNCDDLLQSVCAQVSKPNSLNRVIVEHNVKNIVCELEKKLRELAETKLFVYDVTNAAQDKGYISFGCNPQGIAEFENMAIDRHICYATESGAAAINSLRDSAPVQRNSNLYACISIRAKLQLLGFDMAKDCDDDLSDEYLKRYAKDDKIVYRETATDGRRIVDYGDCEFKRYTVRNILAMQEHQRWNAYEICNGYIPATVDDITHKSKNQIIKEGKHRNITTYEGMIAYRDLIARQTGASKSEADVIKYDYQLMDDVIWLLKRNGYKIVYKGGFKSEQ